ncbi:MAG: response regulator transcription factor [Actinomycetota bacterium]|nr:response regulator transcription factor [Actinomycetota bacterium]
MSKRMEVACDPLRILVVDANVDEADKLVRSLSGTGHSGRAVTTGAAAIQGHRDCDVVVLDMNLPDRDGLGVCCEIRKASDVAIIAVTGRNSEFDRVAGLRAGADDCVVKPCSVTELLARVDAVMRRIHSPRPSANIVLCGPLVVDASRRVATMHGQHITLTRKEFDLLHLLAVHAGLVVPRKQVMRAVWGDSWSRRTIDTHVNSLRNKLGDGDWIVTVRGVGFRLQSSPAVGARDDHAPVRTRIAQSTS